MSLLFRVLWRCAFATFMRARLLPFITLCAGTVTAALAGREYSYVLDINDKRMFDYQFIDLLKRELGSDYHNLQIFVNSCYGGGFADEAINQLQGTWSVTTCRNKVNSVTETEHTNARHKGEAGLRIGDLYYYGYRPAWMQKLKTDADASAKALWQHGRDHDIWVNVHPQFRHGGGGDTSRIHDGPVASFAVIWGAWQIVEHDHPDAVTLEFYRTLISRGYENFTIDFAYMNLGGQSREDIPIDRNATIAQLQQMIDALGESIRDAGAEDSKGFIMLQAHGNTAEKETPKKEGAIPGQPRQGLAIVSGGGAAIGLSPEFAARLLEETGAADDPAWHRVGRPALVLSTSEETFSGDVAVSLDGIPAGNLILQGSTVGGDYELLLSDGLLASLDGAGALDDGRLLAGFFFNAGPSDFFRIAVEWDFELGVTSDFGLGLVAAPAAGDEDPNAPTRACDTNCDGSINPFDIQPFVDLLQGIGTQCWPSAGDTNFDGTVNGFDVTPFVHCLGGE